MKIPARFAARLAICLSLLPLSAAAYDEVKILPSFPLTRTRRPGAAVYNGARLAVIDLKRGAVSFYSPSGKWLEAVGRKGRGNLEFRYPQGLASGPDASLYVADTGNDRIQILDRKGRFSAAFGKSGSQPGQLDGPRSVAVGTDGRVYVADTGNDRIQVFTREGILLFSFGKSGKEPGNFKSPSKVAVDDSDNVYVLDESGKRLQRFDPKAHFVSAYDLENLYRVRASDFIVDPYGYVYLLDARKSVLVEIDSQARYSGRLGSAGRGNGQFRDPSAVVLSPDGTFLVVDSGNMRVSPLELPNRLKTKLLEPNPETKILISGPTRVIPVSAGPIAVLGGDLLAYLQDEGVYAVFDSSGTRKSSFGSPKGPKRSRTRSSGGIAASATLGIYSSDAPDNRVQRFALQGSSYSWQNNIGECLGFWHCLFTSKGADGRLNKPRGVAVNDGGTVYVSDAGNSRVDAFTPEGFFLSSIGPEIGPYTLQNPVAAAWDKGGALYFLDSSLGKIFKSGPSGQWKDAYGGLGSDPGLFRNPLALAFDGHNYLYALDSELRRISVYSTNGRWMTDLFAGGESPRELSNPRSVAVRGFELLISDSRSIRSFSIHPKIAAPPSISSASAQGLVRLSWEKVDNRWAAGYHVWRATASWGPFEEIGTTAEDRFEDEVPDSGISYFYRLATEALSGDVGPMSNPIEVWVAPSTNRPPLELKVSNLADIFPANYKWYFSHPLGEAEIVNNTSVPYSDIKVGFQLKDFMDFATDERIPRLAPHARARIPLRAVLTNAILDVTEETPVQAELSLTYFRNGEKERLSMARDLQVHSRNAIVWKDPARIANFVTPMDPPILDFQRRTILQAPRGHKAMFLDKSLLSALHLWDALSVLGVTYAQSPANPYEKVSEDSNYPVDYTQLPRETLKRKSGQCDDLTTLMASLLESARINTAVLDYPGHMALAFDTGKPDAISAGLPDDLLIFRGGTAWVPLEMTMIGGSFPEAIAKAAYTYKKENSQGRAQILGLRDAWEKFEPVTLPDTSWSPEPPKPSLVRDFSLREAESLWRIHYDFVKSSLMDLLASQPDYADARIDLGRLEYQAGRPQEARKQFLAILKKDPSNAAALNDIGNIDFLAGDYAKALSSYESAASADPSNSDIWLNMFRCEVLLKNKAKAAEYGKKAVALDADLQPSVDSMLKSTD